MFKKLFFLDLTHSSIHLDYYKFIWKVLWLNFRKCGENIMLNDGDVVHNVDLYVFNHEVVNG